MSREIKFRAWDEKEKRFFFENVTLYGLIYYSYETGKHDYGDLDWEQYTGYKDRDGKEIYEGDILQLNDSCPSFLVEWEKAGDGWGYNFEEEDKFKVIGHIHENPKLLEKD